MPTTDRRGAVSLDEARYRAGHLAFPAPAQRVASLQVGLEPEFFPVRVGADGSPAGRLPLRCCGAVSVHDTVADLAVADRRFRLGRESAAGISEIELANGGRITYEPGAQVEHSTAVHRSARAALADVDDTVARIDAAFRRRGAQLAAVGFDLWHPVDAVPQQLTGERYRAQAAYYDRRGRWGAVMMRHTASLQVNLDLGPEGVWQQRWQLANLLGPALTAIFANSPHDGAVATRARAWQELDPTRSGFPRLLVEGSSEDPREHWATAALEADVMLFRASTGGWRPGEPGFSFERWLAEGHPELGWPTPEDFDYHLTTLFLEVRPRGFLELRTGEAVPGRWRPAPLAFLVGLVYDDTAREKALALLEPLRARLPELWRTAAAVGVRDAELAAIASDLWDLALSGIARLPSGYLGGSDVAVAHAFRERFTARGRMPADELAEAMASSPAAALAWARAVGPPTDR